MKVGIAGTGGIGSNVADNLVRSGISKLLLVDFDRVEKSNLNRQNYYLDQVGEYKVKALQTNLRKINTDASIEILNQKINASNINSIFADCDVVVEGFDKKKYKKMMLEKLDEHGKLCVSASGIAGSKIDSIRVEKMGGFYVVGDFVSDVADQRVYASKLRLITAMMSNIILEKSGFYGENI